MPEAAKKNLHVPLPPELHRALKRQSKQLGTPTTSLAREAIEEWLERRRKAEIAQQLREYALAVAGTEDDLDEALASAAEEELLEFDR